MSTYHPSGYYYGTQNELPPTIPKQLLQSTKLTKQMVGSYHFDDQLIPLIKRGASYYYHPVAISQYGINQYNQFVHTGNVEALKRAENICNWLTNAQDNQTGMWYYPFDFSVGGMGVTLKAPWGSSMAQGVAMSLFSRVASFSQNGDIFIERAEKAILPLTVDVRNGGLSTKWNGHLVFEEYPTNPPSIALNGFLFTLIGLYDFATIFQHSLAAALFETGVKSVISLLPSFDLKTTSAYHLGHITNPTRAPHTSAKYHHIHVRQLSLMLDIYPNNELKKYVRKWKDYKNP